MYYAVISFSALLFALQFMFSEGYQKENGSGLEASLKLSFYTSILGFAVLFMINGFRIKITLFSIAIAVVLGIVNIVINYSTVRAFQYGNLSIYSVFSMIGGMLLPFIYGILCGEKLTIMKLICCILITMAVAITVNRGDSYRKAFKYYITVFIFNGMVGIISKFHQSYSGICVDSASFVMLTSITTLLLSAVLMACVKVEDLKISIKSFALCMGGAVFNKVANLMLLIALIRLPASVQYPIVTGGVIVFSTIIDLLRKVKVSKKETVAAAVACVATVFMAL